MDYSKLFSIIIFLFFAVDFVLRMNQLGIYMYSKKEKKEPSSFWSLPVSRKRLFLYITGALASTAVAFLSGDFEKTSTQYFYFPITIGLIALNLFISHAKKYKINRYVSRIVSFSSAVFTVGVSLVAIWAFIELWRMFF